MRLSPKTLLVLPFFGLSLSLELGRGLSGRPWNGFTVFASNIAGATLCALWIAACIFVLARRTVGLTLAVAGTAAAMVHGLMVTSAGSKAGLLHLGASVIAAIVLKKATERPRAPEIIRPMAPSGRGTFARGAEASAW